SPVGGEGLACGEGHPAPARRGDGGAARNLPLTNRTRLGPGGPARPLPGAARACHVAPAAPGGKWGRGGPQKLNQPAPDTPDGNQDREGGRGVCRLACGCWPGPAEAALSREEYPPALPQLVAIDDCAMSARHVVEDAALDKRVYARVAEQDQRCTIIIAARIARDLPSLRGQLVDRPRYLRCGQAERRQHHCQEQA